MKQSSLLSKLISNVIPFDSDAIGHVDSILLIPVSLSFEDARNGIAKIDSLPKNDGLHNASMGITR